MQICNSRLRLQAEEAVADPAWRATLGHTRSVRVADNTPDPSRGLAGYITVADRAHSSAAIALSTNSAAPGHVASCDAVAHDDALQGHYRRHLAGRTEPRRIQVGSAMLVTCYSCSAVVQTWRKSSSVVTVIALSVSPMIRLLTLES